MSLSPPAIRWDQYGVSEILDSLADGVYITDLNRSIVFWNRAAARITGWSQQEVIGRTCYDNVLVHVDLNGHKLCGQDHCPLHRAIVTGETSTASLLVSAQHKENRRVPMEVSVAPIRNGAGEIIGGIEVFRDLTIFMDDLRRARLIQDHMLHCPLPDDPRVQWQTRYVPQEIVGGDFFRIERLAPDVYVAMVADVMGHGVASALFTMQLRSLWEECRQELDSPGRFLTALNARLHKLINADGYFATAIFLLMDAATGKARYVRAGHPPALWYHPGGSGLVLDQRHPALGLRDSTNYGDTEIELQPGDTLLLFTDGAIEITDLQGSELGLNGLQQLIRQNRQSQNRLDLARLEQQLLDYSTGLHLPDDLTLVCAQWHSSSEPDRPSNPTP
jgi:phosphoserine phosphatase RsbU/P